MIFELVVHTSKSPPPADPLYGRGGFSDNGTSLESVGLIEDELSLHSDLGKAVMEEEKQFSLT